MVFLRKISVFVLVSSFFILKNAAAQDIQFSQFYAPALYVNPAFAGSTHYDRIIFHQRIQWPGLDARYITSLISYDRYFEEYKSGIGVMAIRDYQGANTINSTELYLQYSYELGITEKVALRTGLQGGYLSRQIDYSRLRYPDQFDDKGLSGQNTQDPNYGKQRAGVADVTAGTLLYSKSFWFSYSGNHLNEPNQSYWTANSKLPSRHQFTAGYKFVILKGEHKAHIGHKEDHLFLIPTAVYKLQGKSDQVDAGFYINYNEIVAGAWYRGIPVKHYQKGLQNNESIVLLAGWKIREVRISYSFDMTISRLASAKTLGSHELHIAYIFKGKKKLKPMKVLPCPEV